MGESIQQLFQTLTDLERLLREHAVHEWADKIAQSNRRLAAGDYSGVSSLLGAYGGMGSLNDLWLCPENGHRIEQAAVESTNERLGALRTSAFELAQAAHEGGE